VTLSEKEADRKNLRPSAKEPRIEKKTDGADVKKRSLVAGGHQKPDDWKENWVRTRY